MASVRKIVIAHDRYISATVAAYESRLDDLVRSATARTIAELTRRLAVGPDGDILPTAANRRVLRSIDTIFTDALDAVGFESLNRAYAGQFAGQLPYLDEILDAISDGLKTPLGSVRDMLSAEAQRDLVNAQASTVDSLSAVADTVAASAKRKAMFGFAGLQLPELAATLAGALEQTTAQAKTMADTAQTSFYRTASNHAFMVIEKDLPQMQIRYRFFGPDDRLTRPFCDHLMKADKTYTRAQIDALDAGPGQPGPVFRFCGGWNCRHDISVAV